MATLLGQHCTVFLDDTGVQRFRILSSIDAVLPGDLPLYGAAPYTSHVFVHKIVSTTDPKSDTFLRVANVADLTTLPQGRELAVGLGQTLYMSTEFTVEYDDIATASQAKLLIQQRVDNLIADWHAYNDQFLAPLNAPVTPPQTYSEITLPLTTSIVSERLEAYTTAHAEYLAAKGESETAAVTVLAANAAASAANEDAASALAESQKCSSMLGQFNVGNTAIGAYRTAVNAMIPAAQAFYAASVTFKQACDDYVATTITLAQWQTALAAWEAVRVTFNPAAAATAMSAEALNGEPTMDAVHTSMATACTAKIADVTAAASKKTDADKAAAEATTAKKAADEAASAALLADTTTFLAYKEVCPTAEHIVP